LLGWTTIPGAQKKCKILETLIKSDMVIIAGQAKSHCEAWTIEDLLNEILVVDPKLPKRFIYLRIVLRLLLYLALLISLIS